MIVVAGEIVVAPESAKAARAAAIEMGRATRAEPGCVTYRFYEDLETSGHFHVFEIWQTPEALKAHFETPHMKAFRATLATLKFISRDVTRYEVSKAEKI
jgi:quinol monooxygenase YgiN